MRLFPQHTRVIKEIMHREPNESDFKDVTGLMTYVNRDELSACEYVEDVGDNCYVITLTCMGATIKYGLFTDSVGKWASDMPSDCLKTFLFANKLDEHSCYINQSVFGEKDVDQTAAHVIAALLQTVPYDVDVQFIGVQTNVSYSGGIIQTNTRTNTQYCNVLKHKQCNFDLKEFAMFLRGAVPFQFDITSKVSTEMRQYLKGLNAVYVDDVLDISFYVVDNEMAIYKDGMFLLTTKNFRNEKGLVMSGLGECEELLDTYMALKKDSEFSRHVVEMLSELEVPIVNVEKWLRSKIKEMS